MAAEYALALARTVAIETLIAVILGYRSRTALQAIVLVNLMSHPLLHYLMYANAYAGLIDPLTALVCLEFLVIVLEWALLVYALRGKPFKILGLSACMNLGSWGLGALPGFSSPRRHDLEGYRINHDTRKKTVVQDEKRHSPDRNPFIVLGAAWAFVLFEDYKAGRCDRATVNRGGRRSPGSRRLTVRVQSADLSGAGARRASAHSSGTTVKLSREGTHLAPRIEPSSIGALLGHADSSLDAFSWPSAVPADTHACFLRS